MTNLISFIHNNLLNMQIIVYNFFFLVFHYRDRLTPYPILVPFIVRGEEEKIKQHGEEIKQAKHGRATRNRVEGSRRGCKASAMFAFRWLAAILPTDASLRLACSDGEGPSTRKRPIGRRYQGWL